MSERRARPGYHDPLAGVGGAAPAQSALTLRLVLAIFGLVVFLAGAGFAWWADEDVMLVVCGVLALVAAIDIVVVVRRKTRGEPG
jgi:hypothetical protein